MMIKIDTDTEKEGLISRQKNFSIFFRQRCGSTTISRWFFENMGYQFPGISVAAFRRAWMKNKIDDLYKYHEDNFDDMLTAAVIRDPLDRLVSSYLIVVGSPNAYQWSSISAQTGLTDKDAFSFRNFVDFLETEDLDTCNVHWRRLSAIPAVKRGVDVLVRLKDMDRLLLDMNERYGFEVPPTRNSVTVKPSEFDVKEDKYFGDTPYSELAAYQTGTQFKKFPSYKLFYDDELRARAKKLFMEDVTLFEKAGTYTGLPKDRVLRKKKSIEEHNKFSTFDIISTSRDIIVKSSVGEVLFSTPNLLIETCEIYDLRSPLKPNKDCVYLSRVDGLRYGDHIVLKQEMAGASAALELQHKCQITAIDKEAKMVTFRPTYPSNWPTRIACCVLHKTTSTANLLPENIALKSGKDSMVYTLAYKGVTADVNVDISADKATGRLDVNIKPKFHETELYSQLGLEFTMNYGAERIFLKNKKQLSSPTEKKYWLGREGIQFGTVENSVTCQHNPGVLFVEADRLLPDYQSIADIDYKLVSEKGYIKDKKHGPLTCLLGQGGYSASMPGKDPHSFEVKFSSGPVALGGLEIKTTDVAAVPERLIVEIKKGKKTVHKQEIDAKDFDELIANIHFQESYEADGFVLHGYPSKEKKRLAFRTIKPLSLPLKSEPVLRVWGAHYLGQKYHRFVREERIYDGYEFPYFDHSVAKYHPKDEVNFDFSLHIGHGSAPKPRLMASPDGYLATHVWTEHADLTHIRSHRAVYYGHEDCHTSEEAVGGFVKHGHPVTKSVFYSNPSKMKNPVSETGTGREFKLVLAWDASEEFRDMLDELHGLGHDICLHGATPRNSPPEYVDQALEAIAQRYKSPSWIDHGMQRCKIALSTDGLIPDSEYFIADKLKTSNIKYIWQGASHNYQLRRGNNLNLLHDWYGAYTPTPLYWRTPWLGDYNFIHWASNSNNIEDMNKASIDALVDNWGVSINHHYYPWITEGKYAFNFYYREIDGKLKIHPKFDEIMSYMSKLRDSKRLNIITIRDLMDYWMACELVSLKKIVDDGFVLKNNGDNNILGFSFACESPMELPKGAVIKRRQEGDDWIHILDLKAGEELEFRRKT